MKSTPVQSYWANPRRFRRHQCFHWCLSSVLGCTSYLTELVLKQASVLRLSILPWERKVLVLEGSLHLILLLSIKAGNLWHDLQGNTTWSTVRLKDPDNDQASEPSLSSHSPGLSPQQLASILKVVYVNCNRAYMHTTKRAGFKQKRLKRE